MRTGNN